MRKNRLLWFRLSLALIPVILIFLLELFLRIFNLFPQEPLFLETYKEGKELFQLNVNVAKRYFDPKHVTVPNLYPETFTRNKASNTFRIFCLGGSTTAGFPFDYQVPFPFQLKILLSNYYPDVQFEVINLGLSAINSFSVLDFVPEVLQKQPNLIIIYMGHNEFYGAYGSASAISIGQNGSFIRFTLKLQKLRIVQMIRSLLSALSRQQKQDVENTTLIEQVIADKKIIYKSEKYNSTCTNYKTNLSLILEKCESAKTQVMIVSLFSNVKDLAPLGSYSVGESNPRIHNELTILTTRSDSLFNVISLEKRNYLLSVSHKSMEPEKDGGIDSEYSNGHCRAGNDS